MGVVRVLCYQKALAHFKWHQNFIFVKKKKMSENSTCQVHCNYCSPRQQPQIIHSRATLHMFSHLLPIAQPYYCSSDTATCRVHLVVDSLYHGSLRYGVYSGVYTDWFCVQSVKKGGGVRGSSCYVYLVRQLSNQSFTVIIAEIGFVLYIEKT